jgi:hypothetical protein
MGDSRVGRVLVLLVRHGCGIGSGNGKRIGKRQAPRYCDNNESSEEPQQGATEVNSSQAGQDRRTYSAESGQDKPRETNSPSRLEG